MKEIVINRILVIHMASMAAAHNTEQELRIVGSANTANFKKLKGNQQYQQRPPPAVNPPVVRSGGNAPFHNLTHSERQYVE